MNAHIMLFKCRKCHRPIAIVRLEDRKGYRDQYTDQERIPVRCAGCQWEGEFLALAADWCFDKEWQLSANPNENAV